MQKTVACGNCGHRIPLPKDRWAWDRTTQVIDGKEMVVSFHLEPTCPKCGRGGNRAEAEVSPPEQIPEGLL